MTKKLPKKCSPSVNKSSQKTKIPKVFCCEHGIACYKCEICEREVVISGLREEVSNYKEQLYLIQNTVDRMNEELQKSEYLLRHYNLIGLDRVTVLKKIAK